MSYTRERDEFIARMVKEGLDLDIARRLLAGATTLNRIAELSCSSEAADRDRVPCPGAKRGSTVKDCLCGAFNHDDNHNEHETVPRIDVQDQRLTRRLSTGMPKGWALAFQGDPRGYVVRVVPPSYAERNRNRPDHDLDAIGVPSGPSGLRF